MGTMWLPCLGIHRNDADRRPARRRDAAPDRHNPTSTPPWDERDSVRLPVPVTATIADRAQKETRTMARIEGVDPEQVDGQIKAVFTAQARRWGGPLLNHL